MPTIFETLCEQIRNIPDDESRTPEQRVLWWFANGQAEELLDGMTTRDFSHMLIDGVKPLQPEEIDEDFETNWVDSGETREKYLEICCKDLENFYGE